MRPTLSLCMIVKDNAATIERSLSSVIEYIDEAVIVDTGSKDRTPFIIKDFFARKVKSLKLVHFTPETHPSAFLLDSPETWAWHHPIPGKFTHEPFLADFGAARQFGWALAGSDYKFWIDSDDTFQRAEEIPDLLARMEEDQLDSIALTYDYSTGEHGVNCRLIRERFFSSKRSKARWAGPVHEGISPLTKHNLVTGPCVQHMPDRPPSPVEHRNLKILLNWLQKSPLSKDRAKSLRPLFYLGMELRRLFPAEALNYLQEYIRSSTWDEERALAHLMVGEIFEHETSWEGAIASYAQAVVDSPDSPDGLFGLARCFFAKGDEAQCIRLTERAFEIEARSVQQVLPHDPSSRAWKPYIPYSLSLLRQNRIDDALRACEKGLAVVPSHQALLDTKAACLALKRSSTDSRLTLHLSENPPLDTPPQPLPARLSVAIAIEMWKQHIANGDHVRALQFLASLPNGICDHPSISAARGATPVSSPSETPPVPTPSNTAPSPPAPSDEPVHVTAMKSPPPLKIVIWTGPGYEDWSPASLDTTGIGGSETAAVCMARELRKRGHHVTVLGHCKSQERTYEGVHYLHYERSLSKPADYACDVLVISRHANVVLLPIPRKATFLWVHDIHIGDPKERPDSCAQWLNAYDKIFCLTEWHKGFFSDTYSDIVPGIHKKIIVTKNGLDLHYFGSDPNQLPVKDGNRLIYSSSPDRGLLRLLDFLPFIKEQVPDVQLDIFYGFENWKKMVEIQGTPAQRHLVTSFEERLSDLTKKGFVTYHGRVSKPKLAEAFMRSKVWAYPTWFTETSCITAMEAQAAGCVPVTTALAALPETISHGFIIKPPDSAVAYKETFIKRVVKLLQDDELRERYALAGRQYTYDIHGWDKVATSWENHFRAELDTPSRLSISDSPRIEVGTKKLRLACIFGRFSSGMHGGFTVPSLFTKRALTGSESCFFNVVRGMAERGHHVDAVCDVPAPYKADAELGGASVYPLAHPLSSDYDAFISWNEPDLLQRVPKSKLRVCAQQLNDFRYCAPDFDFNVDLYVMPSETHRRYLQRYERIEEAKTAVIPNSINLEMFENGDEPPREPFSLIWSSSPDRGLHVAIRVFKLLRLRNPATTFKIFYRFAKWFEAVKDDQSESGHRAREIDRHLRVLGTKGENGLYLLDAQPNTVLIRELKKARAQIYTCEPIRFTEGFGVSVLDASAAGCVPIISDADALPEVHREAVVIGGTPSDNIQEWVETVSDILSNDSRADPLSLKNKNHARQFDRKMVAEQWESLLTKRIR